MNYSLKQVTSNDIPLNITVSISSMKYDIKCLKYPPCDIPTVACGRLSQRCQRLSLVTQTKLSEMHF